MKKVKLMIAASLLLILALAVVLVYYNREGFTGVRVGNPDFYTLDIRQMNGTDRHTMALNAGDRLQVEFKAAKGQLHMKITAPDGSLLYAGNGKEAAEFELGIPESGVYSITVEARHAKGSIHISLKGDA